MRRILIAEDELIIASINAMMLRNIGYKVQVEVTAEKAIETIEEFKPDAILMDIKFKNSTLDGIEAAHLIRKTHSIPIIFTSGNSPIATKNSIQDIANCTSLSKPIDFNHLKQKLEEICSGLGKR